MLISTCLQASPYIPWTGIDKLPYLVPYAGYWHLGSLPSPSAHDVWIEGVDFSIALDRDLEASLKVDVAETNRETFLYNAFEATFSKLYLNDLIGDPISLMVSLQMKNVGGKALSEPALIHFGEWEWRAIVAAGKEWTRYCDWCFRISGFLSGGIANRGTPWLEEGLTFEQKCSPCRRYLLGVRGLQAFGGRLIQNTPYIKGWGPYEFYYISLCGSVWETFCGIETGLTIESTVWTANFYSNVTKVWLEFRIPLAP